MERKATIDLNKIDWIYEATPTKDGKDYYIWSADFGSFKKRDAEVIAIFIRNNLPRIIYKATHEN